ncbi:MAG: FtsW/RodA/SpoVE family cell cycle protein [Lachnospiraceae bacterium]|nr:FtsW/RodA/SpoVE family cell cycle protein [Lachnospiraceae bacterium]MDE6185046.1 FtsW/RodA/SpoVE family cell cycle protein [Lachnospiraceae bacterium]
MDREEYIRILTEQIRCVKARDMVAEEMGKHIEDQVFAYKEQGMEEAKAMEMAVKDMGDPVETGVSMDRVHRPHISWGMMGIMAVIGMISIFIHAAFGSSSPELGQDYVVRQAIYTGIGFLVMVLVCLLDYSFLAEHCVGTALGLLSVILLSYLFLGREINGAVRWISIGGLTMGLIPWIYLCVPVYGAILFKYRKEQGWGIVKSFLWIALMVLPVCMMDSLSSFIILFLMLLFLFSAAVLKGWFQIRRPKRFLAVLWIGIVLSGLVSLFFITAHRIRRIKLLFGLEPQGANYARYRVLEILRSSRWIGMGDGVDFSEFVTTVPGFNQSYVLAFVASAFGYVAVIGLALLFVVMLLFVFRIALGQKNELGMMVSCGSGMVFSTLIIMYILENAGILPYISIDIPFISAGGSNMIVSYILAGIVMSVQRYKSVLPKEFPVGKKDKKTPRIKISFL